MPSFRRLHLPAGTLKEQIAGKAAWNSVRSSVKADFFTIGYSGRKTDEFVKALKQHHVKTLVDIRQNAISRFRPELSKRNLSNLMKENGVAYAHIARLGVPREIRAKALETGSRQVIWEWYDANVLGGNLDLRASLEGFSQPVAFLCTELDPLECHRHRLSLALEAIGFAGFDL